MILVTGATGLVGAHLCLALLEKGEKVVALYRREKKKTALRQFFIDQDKAALFDQLLFREADLCHLPDLTTAFEGITKVYHCAAYVSMAYHKRNYLQEVNQQGTADLVNLCIENKIEKLIYISSIAALGSQSTSGKIDEETPWNPTVEKTPYAYSKYGAELEVWRASQEGVPVAIVNPGVILGTGMPYGPLEQLVNQIKKGLRFYTKGSTGYVAVEDVVSVAHQLMDAPIKNERFILVAENWSFKEMTQQVAELLGKKPPKLPLSSSLLYLGWALESILSALGVHKKFLSKALVHSLSDTSVLDGTKVKRELNFDYRPITPYLKESVLFFR